jgi:hypothetical protein
MTVLAIILGWLLLNTWLCILIDDWYDWGEKLTLAVCAIGCPFIFIPIGRFIYKCVKKIKNAKRGKKQ